MKEASPPHHISKAQSTQDDFRDPGASFRDLKGSSQKHTTRIATAATWVDSQKFLAALISHYRFQGHRSQKLLPALHVHYRIASSEASSQKRLAAIRLHYNVGSFKDSLQKLLEKLGGPRMGTCRCSHTWSGRDPCNPLQFPQPQGHSQKLLPAMHAHYRCQL